MRASAPSRNARRARFEWLLLVLVLVLVGGDFGYILYENHSRIDVRERERLSLLNANQN